MFTELTRPLSYLSIRHSTNSVQWINWWAPFLLAGIVCGIGALLDKPVDIFSSSGVLSKVLGFIQNLPGFYLAALAAVATFNNPDMDKLMPGEPPTAKVLYNGKLTTVKLTRRRMLCMMFAYLTAVSFMLTLISIAAMTFASPLKESITGQFSVVTLKAIFSLCYFVGLGQMLLVTLWGLFYLGERIHTPDR